MSDKNITPVEEVATPAADTGVVFGTWAEPEKANPYTEIVKQLADAKPGPNGELPSVTITVDAKGAATKQLQFQKAANEIGRTARLKHTDNSGSKIVGQTDKGRDKREGVVKFTFVLGEKHKARRGQDSAE